MSGGGQIGKFPVSRMTQTNDEVGASVGGDVRPCRRPASDALLVDVGDDCVDLAIPSR